MAKCGVTDDIRDLGLSNFACNIVKRAGIHTISGLIEYMVTREKPDIRYQRHCGEKVYQQIIQALVAWVKPSEGENLSSEKTFSEKDMDWCFWHGYQKGIQEQIEEIQRAKDEIRKERAELRRQLEAVEDKSGEG